MEEGGFSARSENNQFGKTNLAVHMQRVYICSVRFSYNKLSLLQNFGTDNLTNDIEFLTNGTESFKVGTELVANFSVKNSFLT